MHRSLEVVRNTEHAFTITLHILDDYCCCPVCGAKAGNKTWRPYDEVGLPSYDICESCDFQFGFDDDFPGPYEKGWELHRELWLKNSPNFVGPDKMTSAQKYSQLENIGIVLH